MFTIAEVNWFRKHCYSRGNYYWKVNRIKLKKYRWKFKTIDNHQKRVGFLKRISKLSAGIRIYRSSTELRPPTKVGVLSMTLNYNVWWGSSSVVLACVGYCFITINPRSTLIRRGKTCSGTLYMSYRCAWKLFVISNCRYFFLFTFFTTLLLSPPLR